MRLRGIADYVGFWKKWTAYENSEKVNDGVWSVLCWEKALRDGKGRGKTKQLVGDFNNNLGETAGGLAQDDSSGEAVWVWIW